MTGHGGTGNVFFPICERCTGSSSRLDPGAFAEYCKYPSRAIHAISDDLTDLEAVLVEPAACATHGIERIAPKVGSHVLLFGCGPTGILLAQLLRQNGGCHVSRSILPNPLSRTEQVLLYSSRSLREEVPSWNLQGNWESQTNTSASRKPILKFNFTISNQGTLLVSTL